MMTDPDSNYLTGHPGDSIFVGVGEDLVVLPYAIERRPRALWIVSVVLVSMFVAALSYMVLVNSTGPLMTWVFLYFIAGAVWGFLFEVAEMRLFGHDLLKWGAWLFVVFFWPIALGVWVYGKAVKW